MTTIDSKELRDDIDESIVNRIISDYGQSILDDIRRMIKELHADLGSDAVTMARRTALRDVMQLMVEKSWHKSYKVVPMWPISELTGVKDNE